MSGYGPLGGGGGGCEERGPDSGGTVRSIRFHLFGVGERRGSGLEIRDCDCREWDVGGGTVS